MRKTVQLTNKFLLQLSRLLNISQEKEFSFSDLKYPFLIQYHFFIFKIYKSTQYRFYFSILAATEN